jgi:hypothetical protein
MDDLTPPTMSSPTGRTRSAVPRRLGSGDRVDGWGVEAHLGSGAQSDVYVVRGLLRELPRRLALKLVAAPLRSASAEGLLREAYVLTTFDHPHLIHAHAAWVVSDGPVAGSVALLLPLAETTLAAHLRADTPAQADGAGVRAAYRGAAGMAEALGYLHRARKPDGSRVVLHNDIKPENVLQVGGRWVLTDFGIASAPGTDAAAGGGTLSYLAPEYLSEPPTAKHPPGDIWALGVVLHRWLSGEYPFPGDTPWERTAAVRRGDDPVLAVRDEPARELVAAMLARRPEDRPRAVEVARRLRLLSGPDRRHRSPRGLLRSRAAVAAAALLVGLGAGLGGYAAFLAPARGSAVILPSYGVARSLKPGQQVPIRSQPHSTTTVTAMMPDGAPAGILCTVHGDRVHGNWGSTDLWDKVLYGRVTGWVSDGLLYTGTNAAVAPDC